MCRFGFQVAIESKPRDNWRWGKKKNAHDFVGTLHSSFLPGSACYHLFFRVLEELLHTFCLEFLTAFSGKNKTECSLHLDQNWNLSPGFCPLPSLEVASFQYLFIGVSYLNISALHISSSAIFLLYTVSLVNINHVHYLNYYKFISPD